MQFSRKASSISLATDATIALKTMITSQCSRISTTITRRTSLPTPPLSPSCLPWLSSPSMAEQLEMVTEFLGDDEDYSQSQTFPKSILNQDCMWSGFSAAAKLEKVVSKRLASLHASRKDSASGDNAENSSGAPWRVNRSDLQDLNTAASECIDPSMVFSYSTAEIPKHNTVTPPCKDLGLDTPPNSDGEEDEDGDDESDDDDDEEDQEEDDVGTVEKRQFVNRCNCSLLILKRCHVSIEHNYAVPSIRHKQPAVTRLNGSEHSRVLKQSSSNPQTSDTKNYDKRIIKNNNKYVYERLRRKKLRLSLFALKDEIPEVAYNDKVAEELILNKAIECIYNMQSEEKRLHTVKKKLRRKSKLLKQRLAQQQGLHALV